ITVKLKADGSFISQDKYVAEILKKFNFVNVKTASTPIETQKPLVKDEEAIVVDVHLYRFMIGSLMYLTVSRPDIMFAVCACSRFLLDSDYAGAILTGRPSEAQPTPSPPHSSEAPVEPQSDPSPRPSPSTTIPDSILESSGGNLGGHSSSDKSLSGNEGDMTLQSVYDLCISLCTQVSDQAKEIQKLKAQIKKLKKQAKPVITHHRAWMKSVSLQQRLAGKRSLKKNWMQKEYVSKQGRKSAKGEPSVHKDKLFDKILKDLMDYIETEDAQDFGRTRDVVDEEKENAKDVLSIEDVLSTAQQKVVLQPTGKEERKRLAEEEATNEALIRNYDDIKAKIEADRLLTEKLQEEEREQFTIEERAKFLHDTIAAQRKFLAQQRSGTDHLQRIN
ncbi:uncharacterized mitochondrial protein-like protein, partial [Tanacetum coccineum]